MARLGEACLVPAANISSCSCTIFAWGDQVNWGMALFFPLCVTFYYLCGPVVHAVS